MQPYTDSLSSLGYSAHQYGLLSTFEHLIALYGIKSVVNEPFPITTDPVSVDIEHDEEGGFVGCGLYIGSTNIHYWYTDSVSLNSVCFPSLSLIAHNGISDIDLLQYWGVLVDYRQLVHDTMLIGHLLDSSLKSYGLKDMAKRDLGISYPSYDDIVGKRTAKQATARLTLDKQPPRLVQLYNAMDVFTTYKLYEKQKECFR